MEKLFKAFWIIVGGFMLMGIIACFLALPTMLLWNSLVPDLLGLRQLGFFEAMGVNLLCGFLFRGGSSAKS